MGQEGACCGVLRSPLEEGEWSGARLAGGTSSRGTPSAPWQPRHRVVLLRGIQSGFSSRAGNGRRKIQRGCSFYPAITCVPTGVRERMRVQSRGNACLDKVGKKMGQNRHPPPHPGFPSFQFMLTDTALFQFLREGQCESRFAQIC